VLAGNSRRYIDGLTAYREGRVGEWCAVFARATETPPTGSIDLASRFNHLQRSWLQRSGAREV